MRICVLLATSILGGLLLASDRTALAFDDGGASPAVPSRGEAIIILAQSGGSGGGSGGGGGAPDTGGGDAGGTPADDGMSTGPGPIQGGDGDGREWSAFASDERGNWGYGAHQVSEAAAGELALDGCGGAGIGCKIFWTTRDQCVAYAESRQDGYWYAAGGGASKEDAEANAIRFCQSGTAPANSCRVLADTSECR